MNPFFRWLGGIPLTLGLLFTFAVAIATATFIEAKLGTPAARALVYGAHWFEALLALLVVNLIVSLFIHMPYRIAQLGFVITHISFIVVLVSAGITRFFGFEGTMHIREGQSSNVLVSNEPHVLLQMGEEKGSFVVPLYHPTSAHGSVHLGTETYRVDVREFWPHYEERLFSGGDGPPAAHFVFSAGDDVERPFLQPGDHWAGEGLVVHFLAAAPAPAAAASPRGEIEITAGDESGSFPVPARVPASYALGDYRFRITEFHPDFRVGREASAGSEMRNPAVRLEIRDPAGTTESRLLFALHPDFSMGHAGGGPTFDDVHATYRWGGGLDLWVGEGGGLMGQADFDLERADMRGEPLGTYPAGVPFELKSGELLRRGTVTFALSDFWPSTETRGQASENEMSPEAVRLQIADAAGDQTEAVVTRGVEKDVSLGGHELAVTYGPVLIDLPYSIHLDDFVLETYPGSENPAGFESHVRLYDEQHGVDGRPVRIYMNHPLTYRGFKHFQSSYDQDRKGTILSVNHDPGKWPTYFGYAMMAVGFLITLTRGVLWHPPMKGAVKGAGARGTGARKMAALLLAAGLSWGGVLASGGEARAQGAAPPARNYLTPPVRAQLERLMVQDFQGRMKPLDTLSREMVMKITKKPRFEGWEPLDLYLSWLAAPDYWRGQPILSVRNTELKDMLGVSHDTRYITPASLFDASGDYRLAGKVDEILRTPDKDRTKGERKLISLDERLNLLFMTQSGRTFRVFPIPGDANGTWLGPNQAAARLDAEKQGEVRDAFAQLFHGLQDGDMQTVSVAAAAIADMQARYGADVHPSERALAAELWLNRVQPFTNVIFSYFAAFGILILAYAWSLARRRRAAYRFRHPLYALGMLFLVGSVLFHLYGYIMRWIAAGHAPLSNGYESLVFISLATAIGGLGFEMRDRHGSVGALSAFLVVMLLGIAMLPTFDPAISPLVPVLASFWLIIHVAVITASYGFLGLAALMAMMMLILFLFKGPGRTDLRDAIFDMNRLHWNVVIMGLAFLSIGTFLGGVWANESWGRYWGWDPKETWALVTILVYATVVHFRFVPRLATPWHLAAGSFAAIASVGMTYFGVNYFLAGLHSYASGDSPGVPSWVYVLAACMVLLIVASGFTERHRTWERAAG